MKTAETINKRTWKVYFKFNSALSKLSRAGPTWYSFPFPSFLKCDKIVCTLRRKWLVFLCMTLNCISERKLNISNGYEFLRRFFSFDLRFFFYLFWPFEPAGQLDWLPPVSNSPIAKLTRHCHRTGDFETDCLRVSCRAAMYNSIRFWKHAVLMLWPNCKFKS